MHLLYFKIIVAAVLNIDSLEQGRTGGLLQLSVQCMMLLTLVVEVLRMGQILDMF